MTPAQPESQALYQTQTWCAVTRKLQGTQNGTSPGLRARPENVGPGPVSKEATVMPGRGCSKTAKCGRSYRCHTNSGTKKVPIEPASESAMVMLTGPAGLPGAAGC